MLYVKETYVNADRGAIFGGTDEPIPSSYRTTGELFRACREEFGRCVSSLYRDRKDGTAVKVGWVFSSRQPYTGTDETYLREVWVEVLGLVEPARPATYRSAEL